MLTEMDPTGVNLQCRNPHLGYGTTHWLLLIVCLLLIPLSGCAGPEKAEDQDGVLQDIRNTTLIPNLGSYDEDIQKHALDRILVSLRKAPMITRNLLAAELGDPFIGARTKRVICMILAREGDERALPRLIAMLAEGNALDDNLMESALLEYGSVAVTPVASVLAEGNVTARRSAASILLTMNLPMAYDALQDRFMIERDAEVRFLCVCGFAQDTRGESIGILAGALEDADESIRQAAWGGLQRRVKLPRDLNFDPIAAPGMRKLQVSEIRLWLSGDRGKTERSSQAL